MLGVAAHFGSDAVLYGDQQRAGVGAVMRAYRANKRTGHKLSIGCSLLL
jgi:hypothetical protein